MLFLLIAHPPKQEKAILPTSKYLMAPFFCSTLDYS